MSLYLRAKSPLRISFAGGGTDIEQVYKEIGGAVLVSTINKYSYASMCVRSDEKVSIRSLDFDVQVEYDLDCAPAYDGVLDLAKACVQEVGVETGIDICLQTEAPPGTGLGGSSSMITALLGGLLARTRPHIDPYELAEMAYHVERVKMGISGGRQDQFASAFGGFNLIEFNADHVEVTPLRLRQDMLNDLESHCMLCYTGRSRLSANLIDKQVAAFESSKGASRDGTLALKELAYEAKSLLLRGKIEEFGHLLHRAGEEKGRMNPDTVNPFIEDLYAKARSLGAYGGKILGAGGGGFLLLFVPLDRKDVVKTELESIGGHFVTFSFSTDGLQTWTSTCP